MASLLKQPLSIKKSLLYRKNILLCHKYSNSNCQPSLNTNVKIPENRGLILGIYGNQLEMPQFTKHTKLFNERVQGKIAKLIKKIGLNGHLGEGFILNNIDDEFSAVAIVGLGSQDVGYNEVECVYENYENARIASAIGTRMLDQHGCTEISVDSMGGLAEQAAEGSLLASWRFQKNKMDKYRKLVPQLKVFDQDDLAAWDVGICKADSQNYARLLCDIPPNQMTPTKFAQTAIDFLCPFGAQVEAFDLEWIEKQEMSSFLAVAKGSCELPMFLEIKHCGGHVDDNPILLIGEGTTFNSGGISLNKSEQLSEERASMAGAATVLSAMGAVASMKLPLNVVGLIPLCENMPSGMASKPGDVIKCLNGKTVVIKDTSNAGVLLLADAMHYGQKKHNPKIIIDVATVSDGMHHSIGGAASGVFTSSPMLWEEIQKAGAMTGDRVWRLPLWDYYMKYIVDSKNSVDICVNNRDEYGQTCLSAAFLKNFIQCPEQWIHMDIKSVGMLSKNSIIPYLTENRMTGRPTRTIIQFLMQNAFPDKFNE